MFRNNLFSGIRKIISSFLIVSLVFSPLFSHAQSVFVSTLPEPGAMVGQSEAFVPVLVKGLVIHPDKPLNFDFIIDSGNDSVDQAVIKEQSERMARYFLAAVTVPEDQLWVNLSPVEKDRIIENDLGQTVLGRDMLAQDYVLKQLTASLIYPEQGLGQEFWAKVYAEAQTKFGITDIPVDTFNKVWIMPEKAEIYEKGNAVYVTQSKLKVMLDSDYLAGQQVGGEVLGEQEKANVAKQAIREIILPAIEKEVNEGRNFAIIRQIYHIAILAKWYRELIQNTLLSDVYVGRNRVSGVTTDEKTLKEEIYQRYIAAYKKGAFDYIKEEADPSTGESVPRKYFSGGISDFAMKNVPLGRTTDESMLSFIGKLFKAVFFMKSIGSLSFEQKETAVSVEQRVRELVGINVDAYFQSDTHLGGLFEEARQYEAKGIPWRLQWGNIELPAGSTGEYSDAPWTVKGPIRVVPDVEKLVADMIAAEQQQNYEEYNRASHSLHLIGDPRGNFYYKHYYEAEQGAYFDPALWGAGDTASQQSVDWLVSQPEVNNWEKISRSETAMVDIQTPSSALAENAPDDSMVNDVFQWVQNNPGWTIAGVVTTLGAAVASARNWWLKNTIAGNMSRALNGNVEALFWLIGKKEVSVVKDFIFEAAVAKILTFDDSRIDHNAWTNEVIVFDASLGPAQEFAERLNQKLGYQAFEVYQAEKSIEYPLNIVKDWMEGPDLGRVAVGSVRGLAVKVNKSDGTKDNTQNGGIDIQNINVSRKTGSIKIQFNDQAVRDVLKNGFNGFTPVIINITPLESPLMFLGAHEDAVVLMPRAGH